MPYLTGDTPAGDDVCYPLFVPNDIYFRAAVRGAVYELANPENWEQFGTLSPDDCAALALAMYEQMVTQECAVGGDMELISAIENITDVGYIEFDNIPQTFDHLQLECTMSSNNLSIYDSVVIRFNADFGNNYDYAGTRLSHATATHTHSENRLWSYLLLPRTAQGATGLNTTFAPVTLKIHDYSKDDRRKHVHGFGGNIADATTVGDIAQIFTMGFWRQNNQAIQNIRLSPSGGTVWKGGSRWNLYGLRGA